MQDIDSSLNPQSSRGEKEKENQEDMDKIYDKTEEAGNPLSNPE